MSNTGLTVVEGVSNGAAPFTLPSIRNIGLIMERERGPVNIAVPYSLFAQARSIFGGANPNMFGPYLERNLFNNAQGYATQLYGVRIVGTGTTNATGSIAVGAITMTVSAGWQGKQSPGDWANGNLSAILYAFGTAARNQWVLQVVYMGTVVETYTAATCAAIQNQVTAQSNYILINFSAEPATNVSYLTGTGTITTGTQTTAEVKAVAVTTITRGATADTIMPEVQASTLIPLLAAPYAQASGDTTSILFATSLVAAINAYTGTSGYTADNSGGTTDIVTVTAPTGSGVTGNTFTLEWTVAGAVAVSSPFVNFSGGADPIYTASTAVVGSGTTFGTDVVAGSMLLDSNGNPIGVVSVVTNSTHLTLASTALITLVGQAFEYNKYVSKTVNPSGGVYNAPVESDFYSSNTSNKTGLSCFDGVDVQIIATTEFHTLTMAQNISSYCANRMDAMAVVALPLNATDSTVESYADALQTANKSFIASYPAWINTSDENGGSLWVPAIGAILGSAYILTPALSNNADNVPPGGFTTAISDYNSVSPATMDPITVTKYTTDYTTNSLVFQRGVGYYVISSRTYSTNPLYMSIHIRILTGYYVRVLQNNLGWVVQKNNTPALKKQLLMSIRSFFKTEYDNGALETSIPFENASPCAYQGICDQTNNPVSQDRKALNATINWIPGEVAEAVTINLNRNDGVLIVSES